MNSWSVSSIRSFHQCSLAWWFTRNDVRPEFKPLALAEGAAMHEVLAHHLRGVKDGATHDNLVEEGVPEGWLEPHIAGGAVVPRQPALPAPRRIPRREDSGELWFVDGRVSADAMAAFCDRLGCRFARVRGGSPSRSDDAGTSAAPDGMKDLPR